jgi:hypothetical protein
VTSEIAITTPLNEQIDRLGAVVQPFGRHRDAEISTSLPDLGVILATRILGEFGDNPGPNTNATARKNYAGTSPITGESGTRRSCWSALRTFRDATTPTGRARGTHVRVSRLRTVCT